jgi:hypothetical protein
VPSGRASAGSGVDSTVSFVETSATVISINNGIAASRVSRPTTTHAPHNTSTPPTNGPKKPGAGMPILVKRASGEFVGKRELQQTLDQENATDCETNQTDGRTRRGATTPGHEHFHRDLRCGGDLEPTQTWLSSVRTRASTAGKIAVSPRWKIMHPAATPR